jgi:hypothetical protein
MRRESWAVLGATYLLSLGAVAPDALVFAQVPPLRPSLDVILVLDQSGLMKRSDPQRVVLDAVGAFVVGLRRQDGFELVLYGGQARAAYPLTSDATRREARKDLVCLFEGATR